MGSPCLPLYPEIRAAHIIGMTVREITLLGNPILFGPAAPVADPCRAEMVELVTDMQETLAVAGGIGLAAPQLGVALQVMIFHLPPARSADGQGVPLTTLFNPSLEPLSDEVVEAYEACLSVPGLAGLVPRWRYIRYRGWGMDGQLIEREVEGMHARVVQHEYDHLIGLLYLSHVKEWSNLAMTAELHRQAVCGQKDRS